jgi:hypothetical protein
MTNQPISTPDDDDPFSVVAEAEEILAAARAEAARVPAEELEDDEEAETRRVRQLRAEVHESRKLAELQADETPLMLDSPKVRRRLRAGYEAERLHEVSQRPAMRAWQAARMRRVLVTAGMVSLVLALVWSTAGVQVFASEDHAKYSAQWLFAWLVEPFMSLALLTVVGAKAYMGTRGQPIDSTKLDKIEYAFLGLTLGMNAWPHLPGVAAKFTVSGLVLHILGPIVAVAIVMALPIVLEAFAGLNHAPMRAAQIEFDQRERDNGSRGDDGLKSATDARRAAGEQTRQRIAAYMDTHPDHTVEQTAEALRISIATVKRHRRAIQQEGE